MLISSPRPQHNLVQTLISLLVLLAVFALPRASSAQTTTAVNDNSFIYSGGWTYSPGRGLGDVSDDVHATQNNGDSVSYQFTGSGISYTTETNSDEGNVQVYLDGALQATVNCYNATRKAQQVVWSSGTLADDSHTLKLVKQDGTYMLIDALQVTAQPNYSLVAPSIRTLFQGTTNKTKVFIGNRGGFTGSVVLTVSGLPAGVTASFDPASVPGNGTGLTNSVLTLTASPTANTGTALATITGTSGTLVHSVTFRFPVYARPILTSIAVSPATASLMTGGAQTFTAVAKDQNGAALTTQPPFTWTATGSGSVTSAGVYSAGAAVGTATVTATSGTVSGTAAATVVLGVPTGLTATTNDAYISLAWQPIVGATSYNVYQASSPQATSSVVQSVTGNSTIDSNIILGKTYYYQVSAVAATSESGLSSQVSVMPAANLKPVVKMTTPIRGTSATAGTSLLLTAAAMPRSGTISSVGFFMVPAQYDGSGNPVVAAGTPIGTATASPYQTTWNGLPVGNFFLTAVATDNAGHTAVSLPIAFNVLSSPSGTTLTVAQAIQAAQAFSSAIGAPISAGTPTSATVTTASPTYNGVVWQVRFSGAASIEIADASGVVVSYFNYTLANQLNANSQGPGTPITQAQAQTIAASVLQASQQPPTELANQQFTQSNLLYPATYAGDLWTVCWNRVAAGAPYRRDQATLLLQAETGAVEAWKLAFRTPVLTAVTPTVSRSQAQSIAQATMNAQGSLLGLSGQTFRSSQQIIVQPNTLWPPSGSTTPGSTTPIPGSASRIVWDCFFSNVPASGSPSGSTSSEIWVDAAAGQVIGGDILRAKLHRSARQEIPKPLVPMAKPTR